MEDLSTYCERLWDFIERRLVNPMIGESYPSKNASHTGYGDWIPSSTEPGVGHWIKRFQHGTVKTLVVNHDPVKRLPSPEPKEFTLWRQVFEVNNGDVTLRVVRYFNYQDIQLYLRHNLDDILNLELAFQKWTIFSIVPSPITDQFADELSDIYLSYPRTHKASCPQGVVCAE